MNRGKKKCNRGLGVKVYAMGQKRELGYRPSRVIVVFGWLVTLFHSDVNISSQSGPVTAFNQDDSPALGGVYDDLVGVIRV